MADASGHSIVIRQNVPSRATERYDQEMSRLHEKLRVQPGFTSVEVIRQRQEASTRYVVVALFEGEADAQAWLASTELHGLRQSLDAISGAERSVEQFSGREIWFDGQGAPRQAPFWKRALLSIVAVLPSLFLLEWLIGLPGFAIPALALQVLTVSILCVLLTWPIMPFAERIAGRWLNAD